MDTTEAPLFSPLLMQDAPLESRCLLEQAHRYFGFVPNLLATLAHSPSALRVYLAADHVSVFEIDPEFLRGPRSE